MLFSDHFPILPVLMAAWPWPIAGRLHGASLRFFDPRRSASVDTGGGGEVAPLVAVVGELYKTTTRTFGFVGNLYISGGATAQGEGSIIINKAKEGSS